MKNTRQRIMLQGLHRVAGNTTSLFTSDVVNRVATFALYALVARYLGAFAFGQLSLAFEIFYMFQAWERMHYIAYVNIPISIMKLSLVFLILYQGYGLYHLIVLLLILQAVILGFEWWLMLGHIVKPRLCIDAGFSIAMLRSTSTLMGIDAVITITASIDILLLSRLASETEVGLYNAAVKSMMPLMLFAQSVVLGIFPAMCRRFESNVHKLKQLSERVLEILLVIAVPMAVGLFFLADSALLLLCGVSLSMVGARVLSSG